MATEAFFVGDLMKHYCNDPVVNTKTAPELKLYRPKINYLKAILFVVLQGLLSFCLTYLYYFLHKHERNVLSISLKNFWIGFLFFLMITSRFSCIWFVRLYQKYAKSETRLRCLMTPSCSDYAIMAFQKYGTLVGGIKTFKRLLRCHPPGEIDYP